MAFIQNKIDLIDFMKVCSLARGQETIKLVQENLLKLWQSDTGEFE